MIALLERRRARLTAIEAERMAEQRRILRVHAERIGRQHPDLTAEERFELLEAVSKHHPDLETAKKRSAAAQRKKRIIAVVHQWLPVVILLAILLLLFIGRAYAQNAPILQGYANGTLIPGSTRPSGIFGIDCGPGTTFANNILACPGTAMGGVTSVATTAPISGGTITSTGTISCPTCATTTNGGALSGTAPIAVSAAGVISGGGLGTVTGALKGNGSGAIAQAACADLSNGSGGCSMTTTAGGDLSGTLPSPTVTNLSNVSNASLATAAIANTAVTNAKLANSSVTINTAAPLGGGGAVSLGGTLNLTCASCLGGGEYTTFWTLWPSVTITHNLGSLNIVNEYYDQSGNQTIPQSVQATNVNTAIAKFGSSFTGSTIALGSVTPILTTPAKYTTSWSAQTSVTVTENLGTTAVQVFVYDGSGNFVFPQSTQVVDQNTVALAFGSTFTGSVAVLGGAGGTVTEYSTSWTSQTSVTVTHNLGTTAVGFEVHDTTGKLAFPQTVQVTGANTMVLTFPAAFSGSITVIG